MTQIPRPEYPRPQLRRADWLNLNGTWSFALDQGVSGEARGLQNSALPDTITVPFCPESRLSGVAHTDFINACWYRRELELPQGWERGRVLLHFGAVDYLCRVWVNGEFAGEHRGGYVSFTMDITRLVEPGMNAITVEAQDDNRHGVQPSGKQSPKYASAGCLYTRTTGIWQTVWLEHVPEVYIEKLFITPDLETHGVYVRGVLNTYADGIPVSLTASYEGRRQGNAGSYVAGREFRALIEVEELYLWELGCGRLYDLTVELGEDKVESYFGLRSVALKDGSFCLNGKPVFQRTVLDQGFNPEGIITAPTDGHLRRDIELSMAAGFNGARLHQKIFEPRFLYWADRLGYMVWGEHGNWGLDVGEESSLTHFLPEWLEAVERDYSHPAIIGWCPFNETEGNTAPLVLESVYRVTKALDATRPCIDTSGWVHCEYTDVYDYHDYNQDPEALRRHTELYVSAKEGEEFPPQQVGFARSRPRTHSKGQPVFISEYGGIGWRLGQTPGNSWGYGNNPTTEEEFFTRLEGLTNALLTTKGVMGFCYTQLTDVEQEINGIYTYERGEKFPTEKFARIFRGKAWNE